MVKLKIALIALLLILLVAAVFLGLFYYSKSIEKSEYGRAYKDVKSVNDDNLRETDMFFSSEIEALGILSEILASGDSPLFEQTDTLSDGGDTGYVLDPHTGAMEAASLAGVRPTSFVVGCLSSYLDRGMDYIALSNADGLFYLAEYEGVADVIGNASDRRYYKQAVAEKKCKIDFIVSSISRKETLVIAYPVVRQDTVIACLIVSIFRESLADLLAEVSQDKSGIVSIVIDKDYNDITGVDFELTVKAIGSLKKADADGRNDSGVFVRDGFFIADATLGVSSMLSNDNIWRVLTVIPSDKMLDYFDEYTKKTRVLVSVISTLVVIIAAVLLIILNRSNRKKYALEIKQKLILSKFKKCNFEYDSKNGYFYFWPETRKLLGLAKDSYKLADLIGAGFVYPADKGKVREYWIEVQAKGEVRFEIKLRNSKHLSVEMYHLVSEKDKLDCYFGFVEDITSIVAKQQMLEKRAMTDGLTKLRNRDAAIADIETNINEKPNNRKALYIVDIDEFKQINDKYGHYVGDIVLQKVANALNSLTTEHGLIVGRFGGDEFCVFAVNVPTMNAVKNLGQLIVNKLSMLTISDEIDYFIECSVGISVFPRNGMDFNELYQCADNALYEAKETYGSCYVLYGGGLSDSESNLKTSSVEIAGEPKEDNYGLLLSQGENGVVKLRQILTSAIANNEFVSYKQPMISTRDGSIAAEALARWNNPLYGLLNPNKFVLLFERSKIIESLDNCILELTFREISERFAAKKPAVNISVNQSLQTISQPYYINKIADLIKRYGAHTEYITIEITERGLFTGLRTITKVVKRLHDFGFKIAIDDFGSGFTTLSILKDLEVDEIKLDKSFMTLEGADNRKSNIIVRQIITMAHELNIQVVAEGVETYEQAANLIEAGVDYLQGFYIGKGVSTENFYMRLDEDKFPSLKEMIIDESSPEEKR